MCINKHWKDEKEINKNYLQWEEEQSKKRQKWECNFFALALYIVLAYK